MQWLKSISINSNIKKHDLLQSAVLEESGSTKLSLLTIITVFIVFFILLVWSALTQIEETSISPGKVIPKGETYSVQHLEGGIVDKILVNNGDKVAVGQVLLTLSTARAQSELDKLKTREIALQLDLIRLNSFLNDKTLSAEDIYQELAINDIHQDVDIDKMVRNSVVLLKQQDISRDKELQVLENKSKHLSTELSYLQSQIENRRKRLKIMEEATNIYSDLSKTKSVSKISMINAAERYNETEGELLDILAAERNLKNELDTAKQQIENFNFDLAESTLEQISQIETDLLGVRKILNRSLDTVDRLTIRAKEAGTINGLKVDAGSVVGSGSVLMEIVPLDKQLIVESKISTLDIGHVSVGDPVNVKVSTYNYVTYGRLTGKVESISAATFIDENNNPYYKATVELEKNYIGNHPGRNKLLPGMTVTADIITGKKSLLTYLLKPINRAFSQAFTER